MYAFLDAVRYLVRRLLPFIGIYFFAELTELSILAPAGILQPASVAERLSGFVPRLGGNDDGFVPFFNPARAGVPAAPASEVARRTVGQAAFHPLFFLFHGGALV